MAVDNQFPFAYNNDAGQTYQIYLASSTALILGISPVAAGVYPKWPHHTKYLRHITGRDSTGTVRRHLTVTDAGNTLYATNGAIAWTDKEGNTISREGRFASQEPSRK